MELLIVIAIIVILMLMAIPTVGSLKKRANETLRDQFGPGHFTGGMQYESTYPANGFACTLPALAGDPSAGAPSACGGADPAGGPSARLQVRLRLHHHQLHKVTSTAPTAYGYTITAVPQTVGKTGDRGFCGDQFGTIKSDPAGGTNCTQTLQ